LAIMSYPWFEFSVALAIGLLIGLERERSKGEGPTRRAAGLRTFALAALLGALTMHIGGAPLLGVAEGAVAALTAVSYFRDRESNPGLTTEIGLLLTPLLGALALSDTVLASGVGVAAAVIFATKETLHGFVRGALTTTEVNDGLVFAVATFVIWPQLPERYLGPYLAINPHNIWLLVVLMLAIGACGHAATRALGPRFGLPLAGLASGFVSSAATIGSMAGLAAKDATLLSAAVAGATLSSVSTFVLMALLLFAVSPPTLFLAAPALAAGAATAALYGLGFALRNRAPETAAAPEQGRAFNIAAAGVLGALMAAMLILAAGLKDWLGEAGIVVGAAVAGFVDTHSAAISVASLVASGTLSAQNALIPILVAMTSNAFAKIAMSVGAGSAGFALRTAPGVVLSMAAAWAAALVVARHMSNAPPLQ
jgi:uncharacterized membrane protein (DUF4010 family)